LVFLLCFRAGLYLLVARRLNSLQGAALPDRLYLLDEKGVVVFRTAVGSPGFDVDAWYAAIKRHS